MVHVCFYDEEIISNHCLVQQIQLVAKIIGVNCQSSSNKEDKNEWNDCEKSSFYSLKTVLDQKLTV